MVIQLAKSNLQKINEISTALGIKPEWLIMVIAKETGGTFSPKIKNPTSSATGLIQFMEATAKQLGTSTKELARMTFNDQMKYVYAYLRPFKGRMKSFYDVYFAVFYPPAIGKEDSWVMPAWVYRANKGIDTNKKGNITVADFKKWASSGKTNIPKSAIKESDSKSISGELLLLAALIFLFKRRNI